MYQSIFWGLFFIVITFTIIPAGIILGRHINDKNFKIQFAEKSIVLLFLWVQSLDPPINFLSFFANQTAIITTKVGAKLRK